MKYQEEYQEQTWIFYRCTLTLNKNVILLQQTQKVFKSHIANVQTPHHEVRGLREMRPQTKQNKKGNSSIEVNNLIWKVKQMP